MQVEVKFIHSADLHLGRALTGFRHLPQPVFDRLENSVYRSLERIVATAIAHHVDFVLLAGDLFDEQSASLKAHIRLQQQLERLDQHGIQTFICHGNHDPFHPHAFPLAWPESVFVFTDEKVSAVPFYKKDRLAAMIYGFSYTGKHISQNKTAEYVKTKDDCFHIGMLHGNAEGDPDRDAYAPFKINDLIRKNFDYWALGHIHTHTILAEDPLIVYPGNIQGLHPKETGEKGCVLVTLKSGGAKSTFIATADLEWKEVSVAITDFISLNDLIDRLKRMKENLRAPGIDTLVRVTLTGFGQLNDVLRSDGVAEDLLEDLQSGEDLKRPFVWVTEVRVETSGEWGSRAELKQQSHFIGELLRVIDEYSDFDEAVKPLTEHRLARRYLPSFTVEEKRELTEQVEKWLLTGFLKENRR